MSNVMGDSHGILVEDLSEIKTYLRMNLTIPLCDLSDNEVLGKCLLKLNVLVF